VDFIELDLIEEACEKAVTLEEAEAVDARFFAIDINTRRAWLLAQAAKWEAGATL
jgi:hypothetical protein